MIIPPELAAAPVMLPVIVPTVQLKLLAALDVKLILLDAPLQMVFEAAFVTAGMGLTVTVIVYVDPVHKPVVDVGVTRYSTEPADELLGFVSV